MCFFNPSIDRSIGAKWKYNPPERAIFSDNKTLRLSSPAPFKNFNDEVFEAATHMLSILQNKALLTWDKNYVLHPDIAYNWYAQDWDVYGDGSQISEYGNITFWLYDNAYWNTYTDINGIAQPKHRVDGYDFKFAVDLMQMEEIHVKSEELFQIDHLDVHTVKNSTGGNWDGGAISFYIKPGRATPMDSHLIGQQLTPMPVHILNVSQTVRDLTGNPYELNAAGFGYNPQFSTIWQHWSTNENGYSGVGPYEIQDFNTEIMDNGRVMEGSWSMDARDDYWFPNEWDATYRTDVMGGIYAAHLYNENPEPYYWAFADNPATLKHEKPTSQNIEKVIFVVMEDLNTRMTKFENGEIDFFYDRNIISQKVDEYERSDKWTVKSFVRSEGPEFIVFNKIDGVGAGEHFKKYNVRRAVAHAIDKDQLIKISDRKTVPTDSPVWLTTPGAYKDTWKIEYNYSKARDLMRQEGYDAADDNVPDDQSSGVITNIITTQVTKEADVVETKVTQGVGSEMWFALYIFAVTTFSLLRRRKNKK